MTDRVVNSISANLPGHEWRRNLRDCGTTPSASSSRTGGWRTRRRALSDRAGGAQGGSGEPDQGGSAAGEHLLAEQRDPRAEGQGGGRLPRRAHAGVRDEGLRGQRAEPGRDQPRDGLDRRTVRRHIDPARLWRWLSGKE